MPATKSEKFLKEITDALKKGVSGSSRSQIAQLLSSSATAGKCYEAFCLGVLCQNLRKHENAKCILVGGSKVSLKSSPGPINTSYPSIQVYKAGAHVASIWTDMEFTALSTISEGRSASAYGDYHELDLAVVRIGATGRPPPNDIFIGAECKHTGYSKGMLREVLGLRRELSLLHHPKPSFFPNWPGLLVPARPASALIAYSSDRSILNYQSPGKFFGIHFFHQPI